MPVETNEEKRDKLRNNTMYYIPCECGSLIANRNLLKHQQTKKHIIYIQKLILCGV
jgi:hypothetical protein